MPGLTLLLTGEVRADDDDNRCKAQNLLFLGPHYKALSAANEPGLYLGSVAYDGYPVRVFSRAGCVIYLEGRIYNRPAKVVETELTDLAVAAMGPDHDDSCIEKFIQGNEGSYLVAIVRPPTREVLVFS